jgi:hypothetical protein
MSDDPVDYVSIALSRDQRFRDVHEAAAVENDLQNNRTIKALMKAFKSDADAALAELADTSPVDAKAIALLSVRVSAYIRVKRFLEQILTRGRIAEADIRSDNEPIAFDERPD